jgi:hypothetical protein
MHHISHLTTPCTSPLAPFPTRMYTFWPSRSTKCSLACMLKPACRATHVYFAAFPDTFYKLSTSSIPTTTSMQSLKINVASHVALNPVPEHPVYTLRALQHFFPANLKSSLEAKNVSFEKK